MIDVAKIEELRGLLAADTSTDWWTIRADPAEGADVWWICAKNDVGQDIELGSLQGGFPHPTREARARLIVAMRNALPALLDVASSTLTADAGDGELIARERDNARAECSWLANSLLKYRSDLQNIAHDIEDEGDRYYFGSTNDADLLKEIVEEIENYGFNRITRASKWPDYIRQSAKAHARAESAEARATASESEAAALREISDLMQFVADECVDLRTVVYETGEGDADVAWRVVKFYMQKPQERIIAEESTPIEALRRARTALEGRKDG